ncbi:MAG TPA: hypothetical protein VN932_01875 [Rhizomicrobium sp.]|nr:hypothetical protein [Rhizomicrobium sp.]
MGAFGTSRRFAIAIALSAAVSTVARARDCKLVEIASLPIGTDRAGEITVPVTINSKPEQMAVKMDSWIGAVTQKLADTLELRVHSFDEASIRNPTLRLNPIYMENGERAKHVTQIALLTIGAERVTDTDFIVYPSQSDDDGSVAGLIGHDILGYFDLDFDFAGNKLNLFSPDHCEGKVVYWATAYTDAPMTKAGGSTEVAMTLDGHDVNATIETGATTTSMTFAEASAAFGISQQSPRRDHHDRRHRRSAAFALSIPLQATGAVRNCRKKSSDRSRS